jgi:hypothetical protein
MSARATDGELGEIAYRVDQPGKPGIHWASNRALVDRYTAMAVAVAARVRTEPGAPERLVDAGYDFEVEKSSLGLLGVSVCRNTGGAPAFDTCAPTAVSATMLRLAELSSASAPVPCAPPLAAPPCVAGLHEAVLALVAHRPDIRVVITTNSATTTTVVELASIGGAEWKLKARRMPLDAIRMVEMVGIAVANMGEIE